MSTAPGNSASGAVEMTRRLLTLAAALLGAVVATPAYADSYRLAFSRAENIEIFVEHPAGEPWCSSKLMMRVVYGGEPDQAALERLLPRLGALLDAQCPQAASIEWTSTTADNRFVARGSSSRTEHWALRTEESRETADTATEPAGSVAAAPPATVVTPPPSATPPAVMPPAAAPAVETPPTEIPSVAAVAPGPVAPPVATAVLVPDASAPVDTVAGAGVETETIAAPPPAVPPTATAVSESAGAGASTREVEPTAIAGFAINGWKPAERTPELAGMLVEMPDQNGCLVVTRFDVRQGMEYLTLKTEGLECGSDGYARGNGRLVLERSDGARIARTGSVWLTRGIPFTQEIVAVRIAGTDGQHTLWLHLASDVPTRTHYLLRARAVNQGGIGIWQVDPQVDAVTDSEDRFRQADDIQAAIVMGLAALSESAMPGASSARVLFANDFHRGTVAGQADHLIYLINASRPIDRRTRQPAGPWQYNLQQANNYLFQRDARLAQQRRMEEQRLAQQQLMEERRLAQQKLMEERREAERRRNELIRQVNAERRSLQTYHQLVAEAEHDPGGLRSRIESDVAYEPMSGGGYAALLGGGEAAISRIVRVSGRDGDDARVDWPYEMRIVGQRGLANGWYRLQGVVTLDRKRRDGEDLPLTLVNPSEGGVTRCERDGCADLVNPLAVTRAMLGEPEWTPEAAELRIEHLTRQ